MLELIFRGFVEWANGLMLECWQYFSDGLLDILNMDFSYLRIHVPVVDTIMQIMLAIGWALLLGNLVFQALRSMVSGLGFEGEDPKLLFTRTFAFSFLLMASPQICKIGLNITQNIINILQIPDAVQITFMNESAFSGIGAAWLLIIIVDIIVMFKVFGLLLEIAERYVILGMLTICAPLAFGVGGSRSTSDIFTGWCRMFASMCFVMVSNVIFFKMLLSVLSFVPTGIDVLPWMVLVLTITKVAKKVDAIITRIGLNPAITGDSMGRSLPGMLTYAIIRAATRQVIQTAGKSTGGGARGASPKTPPGGGSGGGPKTGNPMGGSHYGNRTQYTGQAPGTQSTSTQQSSTTQSGGQNASAAFQSSMQNNTAQQESSAQQSMPWAAEHPGSTRPGAAARENSRFGNQATRQSAVPLGTRRAASHVRQVQPGMAGMAAAATVRQVGQRGGSPSGTAGMGASGLRAQPGRPAQSHGVAASTPAGSRVTQSAQQSAYEGGINAVQHTSQQQNISVGGQVQGRQHDSGTAGTRYSARSTSAPNAPAGTAGTGTVQAQQKTAPTPMATRPSAVFSPTTDSMARHGRNAAQTLTSASPPAKTAAEQRTARQEHSALTKGTIPRASGTAGMSGRLSGEGQQRRHPAQPIERARSNPRPATIMDSKKMTSAATAHQEKAQSSQRQSSRKQRGGAERGEQ